MTLHLDGKAHVGGKAVAETLAASLLPPCLLPAQVRWRGGLQQLRAQQRVAPGRG